MYFCSQHKKNDVKKKLCLRNEKGNLWLNPIQTVTDISTYIYIWYCNTSSLRINFSIEICVSFVLYVANVTVHFDLTLYVYVRIFLNIPCWRTWFQLIFYGSLLCQYCHYITASMLWWALTFGRMSISYT